MLGGAQWNSTFTVFNDWKFDDKLMYTCHIYWCKVEQQSIQKFVDFKEKLIFLCIWEKPEKIPISGLRSLPNY